MQMILQQIAILAIITLIGVIAVKSKLLTHDVISAIVKLIIKLTLPLLLFTSFAHANFTVEMLKNGIFVLLISILSVVLLFLFSSISAYFFKLNRENQALHRANSMFGNVVFLGFPLLDALYPGGEGLLYAGIFQLGHDTLMWTWGIYILKKGAAKQHKNSWKHLINPVTIAFALGLLFMFIGIKIPFVIYKPLYGLGQSTIYLSMIYVGAILLKVNILTVLKNYRSWIVSLHKLLAIPFLILLLLKALIALEWIAISPIAVGVIVLQAGMPCMILISVLAKDLGLNDKQAVENIFLSTVLSLATLPLLYYFI
jgi:hypothetical protein